MAITLAFGSQSTYFNLNGAHPTWNNIWEAKSLEAYIPIVAGGIQRGSEGDAGLRDFEWMFFQIRKNGVDAETEFGRTLNPTLKYADRSTLTNAGWLLLTGTESNFYSSSSQYVYSVSPPTSDEGPSGFLFNLPMELGDNQYVFYASGESTHGSGYSTGYAVFTAIPDRTPPLLTLRNKTGQFSAPPITLEVDLFDEISGASKVTGTIDGTAIPEITTFPSDITINTTGTHEVILYGHDVVGNITAPLTYRFKAEPWDADSDQAIKALTVTGGTGTTSNYLGVVTIYKDDVSLNDYSVSEAVFEADLYQFENISQGTVFSYPIPTSAPGVGLNIYEIEVFNNKIVVSFLKSFGTNDFEDIHINVKDSSNVVQDFKTYDRAGAAALASWRSTSAPHESNLNKITLNVAGIEGETYTVDLFGTTIYTPSNDSGGVYVSDDEVYTFTPVGPKWSLPEPGTSVKYITYNNSLNETNYLECTSFLNDATTDAAGFLNGNAQIANNFHLFIGMADGEASITVDDTQCAITGPVLDSFENVSPATPDANGDFIFFNPLVFNIDVGFNIFSQTNLALNAQYYKARSFPSGTASASLLATDIVNLVSFTPDSADTTLEVYVLNACGDKITRTMNIKYQDNLASSNPSSPISGTTVGAGATTVNSSTQTGSTPFYHSLIVTR